MARRVVVNSLSSVATSFTKKATFMRLPPPLLSRAHPSRHKHVANALLPAVAPSSVGEAKRVSTLLVPGAPRCEERDPVRACRQAEAGPNDAPRGTRERARCRV